MYAYTACRYFAFYFCELLLKISKYHQTPCSNSAVPRSVFPNSPTVVGGGGGVRRCCRAQWRRRLVSAPGDLRSRYLKSNTIVIWHTYGWIGWPEKRIHSGRGRLCKNMRVKWWRIKNCFNDSCTAAAAARCRCT